MIGSPKDGFGPILSSHMLYVFWRESLNQGSYKPEVTHKLPSTSPELAPRFFVPECRHNDPESGIALGP